MTIEVEGLTRFPDGRYPIGCANCGAGIEPSEPRYVGKVATFCETCGKNRLAAMYAVGFHPASELNAPPPSSAPEASSSSGGVAPESKAERPGHTEGAVPGGGAAGARTDSSPPADSPREEGGTVPAGYVRLLSPRSYATFKVKSRYGERELSLGTYAEDKETDAQLLERVQKAVREAWDPAPANP